MSMASRAAKSPPASLFWCSWSLDFSRSFTACMADGFVLSALVLHRDEMLAVVIQRADFGAAAVVGPAGIMQVAGVRARLRIVDHASIGAGRLFAPILRVVASAAQARTALAWGQAQWRFLTL